MTTDPIDPRLERAYRRLLLAYPGPYRRHRGAEIVTTLLEMAEPGRRRPSAADGWHLLASGVRQRFRLSPGTPALLVAVLTLLVGGAFGAGAGSWAGERTFADLPPPAAMAALQAQIADGEHRPMQVQDSPWWGGTALGTTHAGPGWTPEPVRRQLAADGWRLGAPRALSGSSGSFDPVTGARVVRPVAGVAFDAERDGLRLAVDAYTTDRDALVSVQLNPLDNGTLLPFTVLGGLLGLALGWLLAASARRRLVLAASLSLALPAVALYGNVMRAFRYAGDAGPVFTVHSALNPGTYWPFGPPWLNAVLAGAGLLLVLAAGVVPARRAAPARIVVE